MSSGMPRLGHRTRSRRGLHGRRRSTEADIVDALRAFQMRKSAPAIDNHALGSVKTRARAERLHPGGNREIAELLPGSREDYDSRLRDAIFRRRGNAHRLV